MDGEFSWTPEPDSGVTMRWVEANGQRFELAEAGSGNRLALCLHGFPELHYSWRFQIPMLVERGYRVWAPNMRGYGGSSRPTGIDAYALDQLTEDVAALIDASGADEVTLIAHDWGAIVAWAFAIRKLRPLARLVILNVPHPMVGQREIKHWRQFKKSWYIFFFQIPWLPEKLLGRNDAKGVGQLVARSSCDQSKFGPDVQAMYSAAAARPGALTAMLNYYRALVRRNDSVDLGDGRIETPTLMIWGEEDVALNIRCTEGTEEWVPNLELHRLPGVSHWVQQEAPDTVNEILGDWLARTD